MIVGYVLVGCPGAGKGTIGNFLQGRTQFPHFSTGDLLRAEVRKKTAIGRKIEPIINEGGQVTDELIVEMVAAKIKEFISLNQSFSMDGFPQTMMQLEAFEAFYKHEKLQIKFIVVTVDPKTALERMIHRVSCSVCGMTFRDDASKHSPLCSGQLIARKSDQKEKAIARIETFEKTTKEVMTRLLEDFNSIAINGNLSEEEVQKSLIATGEFQ